MNKRVPFTSLNLIIEPIVIVVYKQPIQKANLRSIVSILRLGYPALQKPTFIYLTWKLFHLLLKLLVMKEEVKLEVIWEITKLIQ